MNSYKNKGFVPVLPGWSHSQARSVRPNYMFLSLPWCSALWRSLLCGTFRIVACHKEQVRNPDIYYIQYIVDHNAVQCTGESFILLFQISVLSNSPALVTMFDVSSFIIYYYCWLLSIYFCLSIIQIQTTLKAVPIFFTSILQIWRPSDCPAPSNTILSVISLKLIKH